MPQVKRIPEDPKLFEQLLLTRAIAVIAGQPESVQLPSRECVQSLLTDDEIETAIDNAASSAGEFVQRVKEDAPMLSEASGYDLAVDTIRDAVQEWRARSFSQRVPVSRMQLVQLAVGQNTAWRAFSRPASGRFSPVSTLAHKHQSLFRSKTGELRHLNQWAGYGKGQVIVSNIIFVSPMV
jgi:hypothetical protein